MSVRVRVAVVAHPGDGESKSLFLEGHLPNSNNSVPVPLGESHNLDPGVGMCADQQQSGQ